MNEQSGKILISVGLLVLIIGVIIYFFGSKLSWIGNLPGDIRIEKENFRFYFPITTMLLFSVLLNLVVRIWRYLG